MVLADIRASPDNGKNHTLLDTQSTQNSDLNTWLQGGARLRILLRMKTSKTSLFVVAGLALLGLVALIQAQQAAPAGVATGFNAIRQDSLRADLTFLASDALQGRMSLQTGDDVAIQWIASEFAKAGLQPAANGSYLQTVELMEYRGDRAQSYVALKRGGSEKQWKFPDA